MLMLETRNRFRATLASLEALGITDPMMKKRGLPLSRWNWGEPFTRTEEIQRMRRKEVDPGKVRQRSLDKHR
jgi:hypothetical protein